MIITVRQPPKLHSFVMPVLGQVLISTPICLFPPFRRSSPSLTLRQGIGALVTFETGYQISFRWRVGVAAALPLPSENGMDVAHLSVSNISGGRVRLKSLGLFRSLEVLQARLGFKGFLGEESLVVRIGALDDVSQESRVGFEHVCRPMSLTWMCSASGRYGAYFFVWV